MKRDYDGPGRPFAHRDLREVFTRDAIMRQRSPLGRRVGNPGAGESGADENGASREKDFYLSHDGTSVPACPALASVRTFATPN
jgi:hypothetical protein